MKCKNCGIETHYCSACCQENCLDEGFCSKDCWQSSDEYRDRIELVKKFLCSLNLEQRKTFEKILEFYSSSYEFIIDDIVNGFEE